MSHSVSELGERKLKPHLKVEHDGDQQQHSEHDNETPKQKGLTSAALYNQGLREKERERGRERER